MYPILAECQLKLLRFRYIYVPVASKLIFMPHRLLSGLLIVLFLSQVVRAEVDVQHLIDQALAKGDRRLVLPSGVVRVAAPADKRAYHLTLRGVKDFEIVGEKTTLVFSQPQVGGLLLIGCQNVAVRGVTLDWDPLPFTQGRIVKFDPDARAIRLEVDPGFSDDPALFSQGCMALLYDPQTRLLKRKAWELTGLSLARDGDRMITVKCKTSRQLKASGAAVGDLVALRATGGDMGIRLVDCSQVTLDQVTLFTAPGMAIQEAGGEGKNTYHAVTVTRGPARGNTERLLSSSADAIHSSGVRTGPTIRHCRLEYQGDDGIAIHGAYSLVVASRDRTTLLVSPKYEMPFRPGDRIRLYDGKAFSLKNQVSVVAVTRAPKPTEDQLQTIGPLWKTYHSVASARKYYEVKVDVPLAVAPGDLVISPDRQGNHFLVQDCRLGHNRARGILVKASSGVIERNRIEDVGTCGIALGPEFAYWLEGDYVSDVVVRNNELREVGVGAAIVRHDRAVLVGAISVYALAPDRRLPPGANNMNLTIESNRIDSCGGIGMLIACAKNVQVRSNTIANTQFLGPLQGEKAFDIDSDTAICVVQSEEVQFDNNTLAGKRIVHMKSSNGERR